MKKVITGLIAGIYILIGVIASPLSFAGDCFMDPILEKDFNGEVKSAVFMRDVPCMEGSVIAATLSAGEIVHIYEYTDGWWHVKRSDQTTGWVGETFIQETSAVFNEESAEEPAPEATPEPDPEPVIIDPLYDIKGHKYEEAIWNIYNRSIAGGYPDGSFKPDQIINRAELLKIIVEAVYTNEFIPYGEQECFSDISKDQWYTKYVCFAKHKNIVQGYSDGTFLPGDNINFVEALKIALIGFGYQYVEGDPWYFNIVDTALINNFIPGDVESFESNFTRGQIAEMITRILKYQDDELDEYLGENFTQLTYEDLGGVVNKDFKEADCSSLGDDWAVFTKTDIELSFCYNSYWWGEPVLEKSIYDNAWTITFLDSDQNEDDTDPLFIYEIAGENDNSVFNKINMDLSIEDLESLIYDEDVDLDYFNLQKTEVSGVPALSDFWTFYIPNVMKDNKYNLTISVSPEMLRAQVDDMVNLMSL